jgi:hypothetical protein
MVSIAAEARWSLARSRAIISSIKGSSEKC